MNTSWATIDEMPAVVPSPDQLPIFEELVAPPARRPRPHLRIQPPLLADLTARQRKAVTHGNGPLLIVAGAGTGKTTVITRRIAWLIAEKRAKPSEILALTFTDRAALEMTERVDRLVPVRLHRHGDQHLPRLRRPAAARPRARGRPLGPLHRHVARRAGDLPARAPVRAATRPIPPAGRPDPLPPRPGHSDQPRPRRGRRARGVPVSRASGWRPRPPKRRSTTALAERAAQQKELAALYVAYERADAGQRSARLRRPGEPGAAPAARASRRPERGAAALPLHPGRRVPGHEPRAVRAGQAAGRLGHGQRDGRGRRRPEHLSLPRAPPCRTSSASAPRFRAPAAWC